MARRIDESKIERIREAALQIISEQGILNCSVAMIAQEAQVSVGYLYRHYPSKDDLIAFLLKNSMELINQRIESLLEANVDFDTMVRGVVNLTTEAARLQPAKIKFFIIVFNDFSYPLNGELQNQIRDHSKRVVDRYKKSGDIDPNIDPMEAFIAIISLPFQFFSVYYKEIFSNQYDPKVFEERIVRMVKASITA